MAHVRSSELLRQRTQPRAHPLFVRTRIAGGFGIDTLLQIRDQRRIFFSVRGRPPPGSRTWSVGRLRKSSLSWSRPPPDRFRMEASDRCDPLKAPMPQTLRLACCHPATLLLIQPAQQQIELPMIFPFRMFTRPTSRTTALVNRLWCAHSPTPSLKCPTVYTKSSISRNRFWTGSY